MDMGPVQPPSPPAPPQGAPAGRPKPLVLVIIDGWGIGLSWGGNAIAIARKPNIERLRREYSYTTLKSFGEAVGLPHGERGNSEVGHLTLGAGRVVHQDLPAISKTISDGSFFKNKNLLDLMSYAKSATKNIHLIGLVSAGGIHSHIEHLFSLLDLCKQQGATNVFIHMFTDGRDSRPTDALLFLVQLQNKLKMLGIGRIVSVSGRYYAMDRDKRWDRIGHVYNAMTQGYGIQAQTPQQAIAQAYRQGLTDEFIPPTVINRHEDPFVPIGDGDVVISFNFRADRVRELDEAFLNPQFAGFVRKVLPKNLHFASFVFHTENDRRLPIIRVFHPELVKMPFAEVIAAAGLRQLHIAETEKYAHVTYFFNGGREEPFAGEDRVLVPSPQVPTYNQQPEMSSPDITKAVLTDFEGTPPDESAKLHHHDVIVLNFAAPDMVGHTGDFNATVRACEVVDQQIGKIVNAVLPQGGVVVITADHGKAEEMVNHETGLPDTEHIANNVPFIVVGSDPKLHAPLRQNGGMVDVAPTLLDILGIPPPAQMTGRSLYRPEEGTP